MADDRRSAEPRTIEIGDTVRIQQVAEELNVEPELVREAVEIVGPNLTAVELWLSAPRA